MKVKQDMSIKIDESILGVKEWECEVISNKNVATFNQRVYRALPPGEHMDFVPGSYAQIKIPTFSMDYDKDIDKSLIGDEYLPAWGEIRSARPEVPQRRTDHPCLFYGQLSG